MLAREERLRQFGLTLEKVEAMEKMIDAILKIKDIDNLSPTDEMVEIKDVFKICEETSLEELRNIRNSFVYTIGERIESGRNEEEVSNDKSVSDYVWLSLHVLSKVTTTLDHEIVFRGGEV